MWNKRDFEGFGRPMMDQSIMGIYTFVKHSMIASNYFLCLLEVIESVLKL